MGIIKPHSALIELVEEVTRLVGNVEVRFLKTLGDAGLTAKQLHYIEEIGKLVNPTFGELARVLQLSKPSITAIIEKFVEQGFVERVQSDEDRRSAHVHLTGKGRDIIAMHASTHAHIAEFFASALDPDELNDLIVIFKKIISKSAGEWRE